MVHGQRDCSLCRFCANKLPGIEIFSELGREHRLCSKILLCRFPFEVSVGDILPKFMCYNCIKKVNLFEEFYRTGLAVQKQLHEMVIANETKEKTFQDVNGQNIRLSGIIDLSQDTDDKDKEEAVPQQRNLISQSCSQDQKLTPSGSKRRKMSGKEDPEAGVVSNGISQAVPLIVKQNEPSKTNQEQRVPSLQNAGSSSIHHWLTGVESKSNDKTKDINGLNHGSIIDLEEDCTSGSSASESSSSISTETRIEDSKIIIQSVCSLSAQQALKRDLHRNSPRSTSHISILSVDS